jgi:hypothetical protein
MSQFTMNLSFYKKPNTLIRGLLLALLASGLVLLSWAAPDLASSPRG